MGVVPVVGRTAVALDDVAAAVGCPGEEAEGRIDHHTADHIEDAEEDVEVVDSHSVAVVSGFDGNHGR